MEINLFKIKDNKYTKREFVHLLKFSITKHVFGFCFSCPNYSTGYYANPFSALRAYMKFCAERHRKSEGLHDT